MAIETHAEEREAKLFAAQSLILSAFKPEAVECQRLNAKNQAAVATLAEVKRLRRLQRLMDWIYSTPPEL